MLSRTESDIAVFGKARQDERRATNLAAIDILLVTGVDVAVDTWIFPGCHDNGVIPRKDDRVGGDSGRGISHPLLRTPSHRGYARGDANRLLGNFQNAQGTARYLLLREEDSGSHLEKEWTESASILDWTAAHGG